MLRLFGLRQVDRSFSTVIIIACFIAVIYAISSFLSVGTSDTSHFPSRDATSLEHAHIGAHHLDVRLAAIARAKEPTDSPTKKPPPTAGDGAIEANQKYKIVGESLLVPKGKDENILFIKTHKCGTSSMVNLFYLYGIRRRLNFVINPWSRGLDIEQTVLPPRPGQYYNMQIAHAIFKPEVQHELLPKDRTFYTTIIRSPVKRFVSAFGYYGKDRENRYDENRKLLSLEDSILKWFEKNENKLEPTNTTCSVGPVENGLARDLGFEKYIERDGLLQTKIDDFVSDLAQEMDFVLLTDYFDECLVLLKEQMGWQYNDILFMKRFYSTDRSRKDSSMRETTKQMIYKYNTVDVQLYNFFHQIYKLKVKAFGEELLAEKTAEFRRLRDEFEDKCFDKPAVEDKAITFNNLWSLTEWGVHEKSCTLLHMRDIELAFVISELQVTVDFTRSDEAIKQYTKKHPPMSQETKDIVQGIRSAFLQSEI